MYMSYLNSQGGYSDKSGYLQMSRGDTREISLSQGRIHTTLQGCINIL